MKFLNKIKDALIEKIKYKPFRNTHSNFSRLVFGTPEEIVKQYVSMQTKTQIFNMQTHKFYSDYCNTNAYSHIQRQQFGVNLFVTNDKLGVETLVPGV